AYAAMAEREPLSSAVHPAMRRDPAAIAPEADRPSAIAEDGSHRGIAARRAIARVDCMLDRFDRAEPRKQRIDGGRTQCRHAGRTTDKQATGTSRAFVEAGKAADEMAAVGKIYVVAAGIDACLRNAIVLTLEWTGGMDHQPWPQGSQHSRKIRGRRVQRAGAQAPIADQRAKLLQRRFPAPRKQQLESFVVRKPRHDARTEYAGRAKNHHSQTHPCPPCRCATESFEHATGHPGETVTGLPRNHRMRLCMQSVRSAPVHPNDAAALSLVSGRHRPRRRKPP